MELVLPDITHKDAVARLMQEYAEAGEDHINGTFGMVRYPSYENWLEIVTENRVKAPSGGVANTVYFAVEEGAIVGTIALRHTLRDGDDDTAGHVGYSIRPHLRGRGKGKRMLALCLEKAGQMGMNRIMITCKKENTVSAKTAMACGGLFYDNVIDDEGFLTSRYWINL